jgi:hypothetical protein
MDRFLIRASRSALVEAAKIKKPKYPTDSEIKSIESKGAKLYLNGCLLKDSSDTSDTPEVWPTAWKFPGLEIKAVNLLVQSLGYVRDKKQYRGHINFTHPTQGNFCQTALDQGTPYVSFFGGR